MALLSIMVSNYQSIYFKQGRMYGINIICRVCFCPPKRGYRPTDGPMDGPINGQTDSPSCRIVAYSKKAAIMLFTKFDFIYLWVY